MRRKENRRFANDSWVIAVVRAIFVKWMKSRGFWGGYVRHITEKPEYRNEAWDNPQEITDFLGKCSYLYEEAYRPWKTYCETLGEHIIKFEQNGYTENHEGS